jgi:hypothetical protein
MKLHLDTLGMSYESAKKVTRHKSSWMVLWLRARREPDTLRGYYRKQHFKDKRRYVPAQEASHDGR